MGLLGHLAVTEVDDPFGLCRDALVVVAGLKATTVALIGTALPAWRASRVALPSPSAKPEGGHPVMACSAWRAASATSEP